jgi:hypothetical protein
MKRRMLVLAVILMGILAALPATSYAGRGSRGGRFYGGWRGRVWYGPRAYIGPGYYPGYYPYYYPYYPQYYPDTAPPVYVAPPQPNAYAAPDPAYTYAPPAAQGAGGAAVQPGGQGSIVTVPGQWVNGQWVPEHQVSVPPQ